MDLNKLKTFYTLAQVKNFSKCAEKLYVTQSAISHSIKALEQSLDLVLIEKRKPGFGLTREGQLLFQSCRQIFSELDKTQQILLEGKAYPEQIRLGSPVEFGTSIVVKAMKPFFDRHPDIHIDFKLSHTLFQPLLDDALDLIIDCKPHAHPDVKTISLFREEYVVIASPEYVRHHNIETVNDLTHCNILSLDKELTWWGNFINVFPAREQIAFQKVTEINHVRGIIMAALCGIGVGFVPRYTVINEIEKGALLPLFQDLDILNDHMKIYIKHKNASIERFLLIIDHIKQFKLQ